jgi:hypothetical protein
MGILRKADKQGTPSTHLKEHVATILIIDDQSEHGECYFVQKS